MYLKFIHSIGAIFSFRQIWWTFHSHIGCKDLVVIILLVYCQLSNREKKYNWKISTDRNAQTNKKHRNHIHNLHWLDSFGVFSGGFFHRCYYFKCSRQLPFYFDSLWSKWWKCPNSAFIFTEIYPINHRFANALNIYSTRQ